MRYREKERRGRMVGYVRYEVERERERARARERLKEIR
jgi:hypothetical protein